MFKMRAAVFSTKPYRLFLERANVSRRHELVFLEPRLEPSTLMAAAGATAVCAFVNDRLDAEALRRLHGAGVRLVKLRCAGFNRDLSAEVIRDDVFARLLTLPNVIGTGHQACFTEDALSAIAQATIANLDASAAAGRPAHPISVERLA